MLPCLVFLQRGKGSAGSYMLVGYKGEPQAHREWNPNLGTPSSELSAQQPSLNFLSSNPGGRPCHLGVEEAQSG